MLVRLIKEAAGGRGGSVLIEGEPGIRSEEHTSELQSQSNLVCRLLLEKKKRREANVNEFVGPRVTGGLDLEAIAHAGIEEGEIVKLSRHDEAAHGHDHYRSRIVVRVQ